MDVKYWLTGLTSRKFLLSVAAFITLLANEQYPEAVAVVLGFVGMEGAADVASRVRGE